ncbi:MAG: flagellar biosynthesis protein FlhB [Planctomycetota bacterium]
MPDDESAGEKSEAPTPKKRQEAREKGDVAKSQDLSGAIVLLGTLGLLYLAGGHLYTELVKIAQALFGAELAGAPFAVDAAGVKEQMIRLGYAAMPLAIGVFVLGVFAHVVQIGPMLAPKKLIPNPGGLNPIKGFKRLFMEGKTYVGFGMNLLKFAVVAAVAYLSIMHQLPELAGLQALSHIQAFGSGASILFTIALQVAIALALLGILDFAYQRYRHENQLKMTKQQLKEELKNMDGDPQIKQRRRQVAMQRAMQRVKAAVPTADFVVTNPTHFSVAVKYDAAAMDAPRVVAKGADQLAFRIREIAMAHNIPIVEKKQVARSLYASCEVGQEIPEEMYAAVAEILAYVYEISGKQSLQKSA